MPNGLLKEIFLPTKEQKIGDQASTIGECQQVECNSNASGLWEMGWQASPQNGVCQFAQLLLCLHGMQNSLVALDQGVKGEFRIRELVMIQGESNFIGLHKENGLKLKLDVSKVYFSPRLAMERKRIVDYASKGESILDAFAGASPFSVGLAKKGCKVTSVDSNPEAEKWSHENFRLNNIKSEDYNFFTSKIEDIIQDLGVYDRIIMNNPTNPLPYLEDLSSLLKPNGFIHLYKIVEKGEEFKVANHLKSSFKCVSERVVHPYSAQSSMMAFDITRAVSNVLNTNQ